MPRLAEQSDSIGVRRRRPQDPEESTRIDPDHPVKRQRVSRACDQCRNSREKCDGVQPTCSRCTFQKRACSWAEPVRKRGVQSGYIKTLELALGALFDRVPGSENTLEDLLVGEGIQGHSLLQSKDSSACKRLQRRWARSKAHKEISRALSGREATEDEAGSQLRSPADDSDGGDESDQINSNMRSSIPQQSSMLESVDADALERRMSNTKKLPSHCWRLFDIYFSVTHSWFPILEKSRIQKTIWMYRPEQNDAIQAHAQSSAHAELWAMFALASCHDTNGQDLETSDGMADISMTPDVMYETARGFIPPEDGDFDGGHINALVLLVLINLARQRLEAAWILIGFACRLSLRFCSRDQNSHNRQRRLRYTHQACFILDTITASRLARSPHLRADELQQMAFPADDDPDEWESWVPLSRVGGNQSSDMPSRSPSYSVTSFYTLCAVHKIQSGFFGEKEYDEILRGLEYQTRVRQSLANFNEKFPCSDYTISGGWPAVQFPSVYLLRMAFLCIGANLRAISITPSFWESLLECLEEYFLRFGVFSIPPLIPIYMSYVRESIDVKSLPQQHRARWEQLEEKVDLAWAPWESHSVPNAPQEHSKVLETVQTRQLEPIGSMSADAANQQLPTPSSYYVNYPHEQDYGMMHELYTPTAAASNVLNNANDSSDFNAVSDMINGLDDANINSSLGNLNAANTTEISSGSAQFYKQMGDNSARDFDALLDDLVTSEQANRLEFDPQFMTNLGYAPGSSVLEELTHHFIKDWRFLETTSNTNPAEETSRVDEE